MQSRFQTWVMRFFRMIISLLVVVADVVGDGLRRITGQRSPAKCVVLYYHSIPSRHREKFAKQMDVLGRCAQPVRADTTAWLSNGRRYAVVTFDDANENIIENALPELKRREIPTTIFVITEKLEEFLIGKTLRQISRKMTRS